MNAAEAARRCAPDPQTVVAGIGTLVAMAGVAHAMYDSLAGRHHAGVAAGALAEAITAAVFLDAVVAACAQRARRAAAGRDAIPDVLTVMAAAVTSGLVSGLHAGANTAGLLRFAVPIIAAVVWLRDVWGKLRARTVTDAHRAQQRVADAVVRCIRAEIRGRGGARRRADLRLVRDLCRFRVATADGPPDRGALVALVNELHHRGALLEAFGESPWPAVLRKADPFARTAKPTAERPAPPPDGDVEPPVADPREAAWVVYCALRAAGSDGSNREMAELIAKTPGCPPAESARKMVATFKTDYAAGRRAGGAKILHLNGGGPHATGDAAQ